MIRLLQTGEEEREGAAALALVGRARAGDQEALRLLYERHQRPIYNLVYRMVGREEAADLTAEAFLRAFRGLKKLKTDEAFASWLRRVAVNLCLDHVKRKKLPTVSLDAARSQGDEGEQSYLEVTEPGRGPEQRILSGELAEKVQQALLSLSPEHRAVIILHHLEGREVQEIAEIMKCSEGTVKSRLGRARENLRKMLEEYVKR